MIFSMIRHAGPIGSLIPCSQSRTAPTDTPRNSANTAWLTCNDSRIALTCSALNVAGLRFSFTFRTIRNIERSLTFSTDFSFLVRRKDDGAIEFRLCSQDYARSIRLLVPFVFIRRTWNRGKSVGFAAFGDRQSWANARFGSDVLLYRPSGWELGGIDAFVIPVARACTIMRSPSMQLKLPSNTRTIPSNVSMSKSRVLVVPRSQDTSQNPSRRNPKVCRRSCGFMAPVFAVPVWEARSKEPDQECYPWTSTRMELRTENPTHTMRK